MNNRVLVSSAICALCILAQVASADVLVLGASKDNTLYENPDGGISNGEGMRFFAGKTVNGELRRGLVAFDVRSIPPGARIDNVTLTLFMTRTIGGDSPVTVHRVLANWGEGSSVAGGEEGTGATATPNDATWQHRFFDTAFWANDGGDFQPVARATTVVGSFGPYSWSSALLAQDVQTWVNNPALNFGWLLKGDESNNATAKRFESRQSSTPNQRPMLTVTFTPPTVTISAPGPTASEAGPQPGQIKVKRTGSATSSLTVHCSVTGTAQNGVDYRFMSGRFTIPIGLSEKTFTDTPLPVDDALVEGNETVIFRILPRPDYTMGTASNAVVTILDNDRPRVTIAASDPNASEPGANAGAFTVTRSGPTNMALTVQYTIGGTAIPNGDYTSLSGSVTIPKGKFSATIPVHPIDDARDECLETIIATLSPSSNYVIGDPNSAVVTVTDNDLPLVRIFPSDNVASEPGTNRGKFAIARVGCTNTALQIFYTASGTATPGNDYTNQPPLAAFVTIPAGKTNVLITVFPKDDALTEGAETVTLTLSNRPTYRIGTPANATVTINDNETGVSAVAAAPGAPTLDNDQSARASVLAQTGTWELRIRGADEGLAFVTFHDDHTLSGCAITRSCFGLSILSGTWTVREDGFIEGIYRAKSGETICVEGKLSVVANAGKLAGTVQSETGTLKLRGVPASDQPDLTGQWLATVDDANGEIHEMYSLSLSELWPGVFRVQSADDTPLDGAMVVSSRHRVSAYMQGSRASRTLLGRVDSTGTTWVIEGVDQNDLPVRISATRLP